MTACADWSGITAHDVQRDPNTLDVGTAIRSERAAADADAKWPSSDWWRTYADPQLNRLIDAGLRDSPTQAMAAARLREALALAGTAHADTLPNVNGTASLTRRHWPESGYYSGGFGGEDTFDNKAMLNFAYSLDLFGAKRNAAEQAVDAAHASAADAQAVRLSLASSIVRSYIQLSLEYEVLDVQQRTLADQQRVLDFAQRRFQAGIATQLEISEAQAPLPQTRLSLEQTANAIALSRNQIAALIGQGPGAGDSITRPTLRFDTPVALPSTLPAELLGHRPDIVALRWRVEAQGHAIKTAKAAFYPNIDLVASGGGSAVGAIFSTFTRLSSMGFTAGPAISLPIFEGGKLRSGLDATTARYDLCVAQYNDGVLNALRDIADQVQTFHSLRAQQQAAAESLDTAQRSFDIAMSGFKRGLTGYLNVLTAQDRLLQEQLSVAHVQAARFSAYADLMTALGGGLAQPEDSPAASANTDTNARVKTALKPTIQDAKTDIPSGAPR